MNFTIQHHTTVTSTMDVAREAAALGAATGLVVVAEQQSGGRGRRGKSWHSPAGNLYCTLLLRPTISQETISPKNIPQQNYGHFSFIAALAVAAALPAELSPARITLKWPNDVLVDGAKIAGILLESFALPDNHSSAETGLLVGIGVNVATQPDNTPYPVTSLAKLGFTVQPTTAIILLNRLLAAFADYHHHYDQHGFAAMRDAWLHQAANLGSIITVTTPTGQMTGQFMGVDENGHLLLQPTGSILQKIAVGEVMNRP